MNRKLSLLVLLSFFLHACGSPAAPANTETSSQAQINTTAPAAGESTGRTAILKEISGAVEMRAGLSVNFSAASTGAILYAGGEVRTGEDGKARVDLMPEGTIVRVTPNSSFSITALRGQGKQPSSKLKLLFGKVFVLLKGGELKVETPSGVASVSGSLLSISVSPEGNVIATCLEGHCSLETNDGIIKLTDGQAAEIIDGELSDEARLMTVDEIEDWQAENPELNEFIDETPQTPAEVATEAPVVTEAPTESPIVTEPPAEEPTSEPTEPPAPE